MLFSTAFVSAALMGMCSVGAVPQYAPFPFDCGQWTDPICRGSENGALMARASCSAGFYPTSAGCVICPPGNTCDGRSGPAQCDTGHSAPNNGTTGVCAACPAGTYQDKRGATACIPCPAGSYGPYPASSYCNKAPSGWFQSLPGKSYRCGTCCGWEAMANGNVAPTNCTTTAKPFAYANSGSGCIAQPAGTPNCVHAATCAQDVNGTCPSAMMNY
ncbi:hypothetical protein B0H17DRAFT_1028275 [Mycena rosella]|uniref:Tyrosine-protein kinase ephrin type A/B receptor-like domain-containing protein n=1 Tax=Mycena rosella TaxID=1033263 RepID=A0AAD7H0J7_MYCRO|nr:hypothetical protein B0H17DRAFT_1028275 [Mycena rosella]